MSRNSGRARCAAWDVGPIEVPARFCVVPRSNSKRSGATPRLRAEVTAAMQSFARFISAAKARFRTLVCVAAAASVAACAATQQTKAPTEWDGLQLVKRAGLDLVYVKPGATLKQYRRVMLDPVQISFDKNWDPEGDSISKIRGRVDPEKIKTELAELFQEVSRRELEQKGQYPVVDAPGEDVLRVSAALVDLYINAPDKQEAGRSYSYVVDAGTVTFVAELRDSQTNTLLARVIDKEQGDDFGYLQIANSVTNSAEARRMIAKWSDALRDALDRARSEAGSTVAAK
jgi:hypothetical protein